MPPADAADRSRGPDSLSSAASLRRRDVGGRTPFLARTMNAGGRKAGSKNSYRAVRRQSQAEKEAQNKKAQATKSANKEKKRKAEEAEAERQKQRNRARFQGLLSGGQTSTTSATSSSAAAAAARGDRSNSNPNGRAAGSKDNRAGRWSTPPQEGDALENSNVTPPPISLQLMPLTRTKTTKFAASQPLLL